MEDTMGASDGVREIFITTVGFTNNSVRVFKMDMRLMLYTPVTIAAYRPTCFFCMLQTIETNWCRKAVKILLAFVTTRLLLYSDKHDKKAVLVHRTPFKFCY